MNLLALKEKFKNKKTANVNNNNGKMKRFLSKVSGAFMLPISVMAIAGLFLGIGAAISSHSTTHSAKVFGQFIQNLGDPIFGAMPILFAAAIVVSFTEEAGVGVFCAIIGYAVFCALQTPFIHEQKEFAMDAKGKIIGTVIGDTVTLNHGTWNDVKNLHQVIEIDDQGSTKITFEKSMGFSVLFEGAARTPSDLKKLVGNNLGILSLQTSVFGGIVIGALVAFAYNKFHTIKLPSMISFFGGKRFVALAVIVMVIPVVFLFLLMWPYIGFGLAKFGQASGKAPGGTDSLIFGFIERALIPFGLHHVFYAPLWWTPAGGDLGASLVEAAKTAGVSHGDASEAAKSLFDDESFKQVQKILDTGKSGDSFLWIEFSKLSINNLTLKSADVAKKLHLGSNISLPVFEMLSKGLGLNLGRFMQGKFPFMTMALPAAAAAMVFAAPKESRKVALGAVLPAALTSFTTGVTEPIEFTFLFLAPWLFWGFHAIMAGFSFMFMNLFGAHVGMTFSGGIIDAVIYGALPISKGTNFWWMFIIGSAYVPIYFFAFYFAIKKFDLATPGRGGNTELFTKKSMINKKGGSNKDVQQAKNIIEGLGGWENITRVANCATRLRVDIKDMDKVNEVTLKSNGAFGFMKTSSTHIQCIFGPQVESISGEISRLKKADSKTDNKSSDKKQIVRTTAKSNSKPKAKTAVKTTKKPKARTTAKKVTTKK